VQDKRVARPRAAQPTWRPGDLPPLFGGGLRDAALIALAQSPSRRGKEVAEATGHTHKSVGLALHALRRMGLVCYSKRPVRWRLDLRHPAARALRPLLLALAREYRLDYGAPGNPRNPKDSSPFPDLDATAPDMLGGMARTRILLYLAEAEPCSIREICAALDLSLRTVFAILHRFRQWGIVEGMVSGGGRQLVGFRLSRRHPIAKQLRAFLWAMVRHVHPEHAALVEGRTHRKRLGRRLRRNAPLTAKGDDDRHWEAAPYYGNKR
jgi:DNA-binding MarR family transcriptional regulator